MKSRKLELLEAKSDAAACIAASKKTVAQVKDKLIKKGYPQDIAEETVGELVEEGRLDDLKYALAYIRSRKGKKILSNQALSQRLMQAGLEYVTIDKAIELAQQDTKGLKPEDERALDLLKLKFDLSDQSLKSDAKSLARMNRFLLSKGFDAEVVREVMIGAGFDIAYE